MFSVREKVRDTSSTMVTPSLAAVSLEAPLIRKGSHTRGTPLRQPSPASSSKSPLFSLLQHSGQVAEWMKRRAWRAGWSNPKLETEFTLFYLDRTILPPIVNSSFHLFRHWYSLTTSIPTMLGH